MTANWRPDLTFQVAFNADPNDAGAASDWKDLTDRFRGANQVARGRQYELDETQAGQPLIVLQDVDEYLNPANTLSPYYPNVDLYRECVLQAVWPNDGSTANYLNTIAPVPAMQDTFYDGSFESYTVGDTVPWLIGVPVGEGPQPVVSTTTPNSGTNDVAYSVQSLPFVQGVSFPVPCIPGRQYTASVYVRQSSASTQSIRVTDQNLVIDVFNRTTASGWGTADVGGAWTTSGGSASNYSTTPGATPTLWWGSAHHSITSVSVSRKTVAGSAADSDQRVLITVPVVATGGEIDAGFVARFTDADNYYFAELRFNTDRTIGIRLQRRVVGVNTSIDTATLPFIYGAGTAVWFRFQTFGSELFATAWLDGTAEPSGDDSWLVSGLDTTITAAGAVGTRSILSAANTNTLPVALTFQQYTAVGSVAGSTTTTTGSYVRLAVTFTATQPVHTVQVATQGTAVAGTILIDDIQHEQAGAASAYITTGPVLYPVLRDYVERWPSLWHPDSQGFEGIAVITCVDAFAPLNKTTLPAAYLAALLATNPAYFWTLAEPSESVVFGESSGNDGPPLVQVSSRHGTGTLPAAGASMNIPGDPGGTGVTFTPGDPSSSTVPRTMLAAGLAAGQSAVSLPAVIGTSWALTVAAWARLTDEPGFFQTIVNLTSGAPLYLYSLFLTSLATYIENNVGGTLFTANSGGSSNIADGLLHLVVGQVIQDATNTTLNWWVDGDLINTNTVATATLGGIQTGQSTSVIVGANTDGDSVFSMANGDMACVAIWNRQLSSTEIVSLLYQAGQGWPGETSGQRLTRYLTGQTINASAVASGVYPRSVDIDTGASVMGPDTLVSGTSALSGCQAVATTENGVFWVTPTALSFAARTRRYLTTTSRYTFGEDTAGGEYPYQGDIEFDFDPTLLYNEVVVTNTEGIIVTASNRISQRRYFGQSYPRDINVVNNYEAIDAASYLLSQHMTPAQRVSTIVLDPGSYPALWPIVLGIEVGNRVTVKRRAKAANGGLGLTMFGDYFVEHVSHDGINMADPAWLTTLQLSPVDRIQAGILDDTTYGLLDSTMVLAY